MELAYHRLREGETGAIYGEDVTLGKSAHVYLKKMSQKEQLRKTPSDRHTKRFLLAVM